MIWPLVRWRWLNRWYAKALGYFWLPCPICWESFGGQESLPKHTLWNSPKNAGMCVCYKESCYVEALKRNKETGWSRLMAGRNA